MTLAGKYQREPADVLFALMMAHRNPLKNEDATQEIAGRVKGLLQEMNAKEKRRARSHLLGDRDTATTPHPGAQLDLEQALSRLKEKYRRVILLAEQGFTDVELCAEGLAKSPEAARSLLKDARERLRTLLGGDSK